MPDAPEGPQLYLITPPQFDPELPDVLASLLDAFDIACLRLTLPGASEDDVARAADALRPVAHARDVPLVVTGHIGLVTRLGLDGVHLADGSAQVRAARKALGPDAIVGAYAGASRHDGMTAGELGADYVSFGPVGTTGLADPEASASLDLFQWWSEMIEIPIVAEGALDTALAADLAPIADFLALGPEVWTHIDGPEIALSSYLERMGRP